MEESETTALFDELAEVVDEEMRVQIAMGRLGDIGEPAPEAIRTTANLITDEVVRYLVRSRSLPRRRAGHFFTPATTSSVGAGPMGGRFTSTRRELLIRLALEAVIGIRAS